MLENVVTPRWLQFGLPMLTWRKKVSSEKKVYLTFDDGPTENLTFELLDVLKHYEAKATFFCIGKNVETNTDPFAAIVANGHLVGNHSQTHLNGWKTDSKTYEADVLHCQDVVRGELGHAPNCFRPPFGRISMLQWIRLRRKFDVVLWDILSLDYRTDLTGEEVARNVTENARPGSIILLHDSELASPRVTVALPIILKDFSAKGYRMCRLDE